MNTTERILLLKKLGVSFSKIERDIGITKNYLCLRIKKRTIFKSKIQKKVINYFNFLINELKKGL